MCGKLFSFTIFFFIVVHTYSNYKVSTTITVPFEFVTSKVMMIRIIANIMIVITKAKMDFEEKK